MDKEPSIKGWVKNYITKKRLFGKPSDEASHILGYEMAELCFTENERLNETEYTQPAILTVSVAFYRLLQQKD